MEETDRIFTCPYCRVRNYIACKDHFRYFLAPSPSLPRGSDILFVPYWRFKGMVFSFQGVEIEQRIVDSSLIAVKLPSFAPSLGVRPQTLKLRFVDPGSAGKFILPHFPFRMHPQRPQAALAFVNQKDSAPPPILESFVGETRSIIYSPVFIRNGDFYDGLLNRPVASAPAEIVSNLQVSPHSDASMKFFPMLCPQCGWDLQGERDTLALLCRNCNTLWESTETGLGKLDFAVVPGGKGAALHLPFWRIHATVTGLAPLHSYADLIRIANLPRIAGKEDEDRELAFWIPAFKVQPVLFLRLARLLTIQQHPGPMEETLPAPPLHPVTLPPGEAAESVKAAIASLVVPRRRYFPMLSETHIDCRSRTLVYIPLIAEGQDFLLPGMQLSINRNALNLGRLI